MNSHLMDSPNMESISSMTFQVLERLELLQMEHDALMKGMGDGPQDSSQTDILKKSVENIEMGLNEAQSLMTLATQFKNLETENLELKNKVRLLQKENSWLRDELEFTKQELRVADNMVAHFEDEKKQHININKPNSHFKKNREFLAYRQKKKPRSSSTETTTEDSYPPRPPKSLPQDPSTETTTESSYKPQESSYKMSRKDILTRRSSARTLSHKPTRRSEGSVSRTSGCEVPARLRTLNNLVKRYASQKRFEVVIPLCKQALEDLEITTGHDHPDVATMLNILALVYRDQKKYKDAVNLLNDALTIRIKTMGENHLAVVATLNSLAVLYCHCGNYKEAERVSKRALEIRKKVLGKDHLDVAKQYNRLAMICRSLRKYDEVEKYCLLALEIYESKFGLDDPSVVKIKNNLAVCYLRQGKCAEAKILQSQVLTRAHEREFGTITVRRSKLKTSHRLKRSEP